jgi:GAF domain-containing protein
VTFRTAHLASIAIEREEAEQALREQARLLDLTLRLSCSRERDVCEREVDHDFNNVLSGSLA